MALLTAVSREGVVRRQSGTKSINPHFAKPHPITLLPSNRWDDSGNVATLPVVFCSKNPTSTRTKDDNCDRKLMFVHFSEYFKIYSETSFFWYPRNEFSQNLNLKI
ncbi:unnamed protein product [Macrosiphum euphorbiae]|uniref:Uncharacterized protein n=1 Tax=Macrosiphum euphorbiae TaxID=13131 RepID=A0AAV0WY45_9HEMI|nr:unnamed protein product [Macrosiphum euphorbiae]